MLNALVGTKVFACSHDPLKKPCMLPGNYSACCWGLSIAFSLVLCYSDALYHKVHLFHSSVTTCWALHSTVSKLVQMQAGTKFAVLNSTGAFAEKITEGMWLGVGHEHQDIALDFEGSNSIAKERTAASDVKLMMAASAMCPVLLWCIANPDGSAINSTLKDNLSTLFQVRDSCHLLLLRTCKHTCKRSFCQLSRLLTSVQLLLERICRLVCLSIHAKGITKGSRSHRPF